MLSKCRFLILLGALALWPSAAMATDAFNNGPICAGDTLKLSTSNITGATFNWTGPNGFTSTLQNPFIPNATPANSGQYCVTATLGGITTAPACTDAIVRPRPTVTASSNSPLCAGQTLQLNATSVPGGTYAWTGPNGFTSTAQNPTIPNVGAANTGQYCVVVTVDGCPSASSCTPVTLTSPTTVASNGGPVCVGGTIQLNATTVPGGTYSWTGPGGFTSTLQNPTISNAQLGHAGQYCVAVTVSGCTSPQSCTSVAVTALPAVTAGNGGAVCVGGTIQLTATTVPGGTYSWTGPGGFTSTLQNPTIANAQLGHAGQYCVTVSANGCTSPQSCTAVVVNAIPTVTASNGGPVCVGATIQLNATTVAGATYSWTGPGGFTSNLQNPTRTNAQLGHAGQYCVTVTVNGCPSPQSCTSVTVNALPSVTASNGGPVCVGATIQLNGTTVPGGTYSWTGPAGFTSTLQNPTVPNAQIANAGQYCLTVTVNGCTSPQSCTSVVVNALPTATASNTGPVCTGATVQLNATTIAGATYSWTGPNGFTSTLQNPTIPNAQPSSSGSYCMTATVNGCTSPQSCTQVTVRPVPSVTATGDVVCVGQTIELTATTVPGATYSWTGPGGFTSTLQNPTIANAQLGSAGQYCVTVTVDGCISPQSCATVAVNPLPSVVASNGGPVCTGATVQLSATLVPGATYAWTGPGGFASTLQNPTIPNAQPGQSGSYCVTVTVNACASAQSCTDVVVNARPSVTASNAGPVCTGSTLQLNATTVAGGTYAWTGPGGFTSTLQNPTIANAQPTHSGSYCVTVTVNGCASPQSCTEALVRPRPSVTATGDVVCVGGTIELSATTVAGASYAWTGPGGFTSTLQNPTIANAQIGHAGQYCVTVTVDGCPSPQSCATVTVNAPPSVIASNGGPVCTGATVQLSATLVPGATYAWTGPGGFTSTLQNPTIANAQPGQSGSYCVTATVDGCTSPQSCTDVLVRAVPSVVASNAGPVCVGATIQLNATTVAGASYSWTGPGGFTSTLQNPTIASAVLANAGQYCVTVTVDGCTSPQSCTTVAVNSIPSVTASNGGPVCVGAMIQLNATAVPGGSYSWTGPGGFTSTLQNPTIASAVLANAGEYCVTVTVAGCVSPPSCTDVTVNAIPSVVASNGGPVCTGATVQLSATLVPGATYAWTGPGGFTSTLQNPTIANAQPGQSGSYCVTATVNGCPSSPSCTEVLVRAVPSVVASNTGPVCVGATIQLNATTVAGASYAWTGPGGFTSTLQNPTIASAELGDAGQYCVTVTVDGCTSPQSCTTVAVNSIPSVTASNGGPVCVGATIQLSATTVPGGSYSWTGPGGFTSTLQNPMITSAVLANAGEYCVTVSVAGCVSPPSCTDVTVNAIPATVATSNGPICAGETLQLSATAVAGGTYSWTGPMGFTSTSRTPSIANAQADRSGSYCVTVTVNGCTSPASCVEVLVRPLLSVVASNGGPVCVGATIQLSATTITGATYAWTGPGGFTSTLQNPTIASAELGDAGQYCVTATVDGCTSPPSCTSVTVNSIPSVVASNGGPVCVGATVQLNATTVAGGSYSWTGPGGFTSTLQNPTIANAQLGHAGSYCVTVTVNGCPSPASCTAVTVNAIPSVVASNGGPVCVGATIQLNATAVAGGSYSWTGPGGFTSTLQNPSIANAQLGHAGSYCVTVTVNGCPSPASCTPVTVNAIPSVVASNGGPVCVGGTIQLNATTVAGGSYSWTGPGGFTSTLQNPTIGNAQLTHAGSYCVTVTVEGCTSPPSCTSVSVSQLTGILASNGGPVCEGETLTLSASGPSGATYLWTGPGGFTSTVQNPTIPNATSAQSGSYCVVATLGGCSSPPSCTDALVRATPTTVATNSGPLCAGQTLQLFATSVPGGSYQWTGPNGFSTSIQNPVIPDAQPSRSGSYCVTVTVDGCESPSSCTQVTVATAPIVRITADRTDLCGAQTAELCGPIGTNFDYLWTPGGATTACITVTSSGTYTLRVTDRLTGCSAEDQITLGTGEPPKCAIDVKDDGKGKDICPGDGIELCGPENDDYNYLWSPGGQTSRCITVTEPGTYTLTVTDKKTGCSATCSETIGGKEGTVCTITATKTTICEGETTRLCGPDIDEADYRWSTGSSNRCIEVTRPGTYRLTVTSKKTECQSTCEIVIHGLPRPIATITGPATLLSGQTGQLCGPDDANLLYEWSTGATTRCINVPPGTYKLRVTDRSNGCKSEWVSFTIKTVTCACATGYPDDSKKPETAVVFDEQDALEDWAPRSCTTDSLVSIWYSETDAMLLGVRKVTVKTASGSTSTTYPVTPTPGDPKCVWQPLVGAPLAVGDQSGGDAFGRPVFPALFITDVTDDPTSRAGDWQLGGIAYPPSKVCGMWKSAVRTIDYTYSPPRVRITADSNPSENDDELGSGSNRPPGGFGDFDERSAQASWNLNQLPIVPGRVYRLYFTVYEGGSSPGAAHGCVTVHVPVILTASSADARSGDGAGLEAQSLASPVLGSDVSASGAVTEVEVQNEAGALQPAPSRFELRQNVPNPFKGRTTIRFTVPVKSAVSLRVYTVLGQEIGTLVSETLAPGERSITWNAVDRWGRPLSPGMYVVKLVAQPENGGAHQQIRKMILVK